MSSCHLFLTTTCNLAGSLSIFVIFLTKQLGISFGRVLETVECIWCRGSRLLGQKSVVVLVSGKAGKVWNWIWHQKLPANIQFFMWQIAHDFLSVRAVLNHRGIPCDIMCPICGEEEENMLHCLFLCHRCKSVWLSLGVQLDGQYTALASIIDWIRTKCMEHILVRMWVL